MNGRIGARAAKRRVPNVLSALSAEAPGYIAGLGSASVLLFLFFWARAGSDPRYGPILAVGMPIVIVALVLLLILSLSGTVMARTYHLSPMVIEVRRGALRHEIPTNQVALVAMVLHHQEIFVGLLTHDGQAMLLGRGLAADEFQKLVDWMTLLASTENVTLRESVHLRDFMRMMTGKLLYGLPR